MTTKETIKRLRTMIKQCTAEIVCLQKRCRHERIRHRVSHDWRGELHVSRCIDCDKYFGVSISTIPFYVTPKTWIERKQK